MQWKFCLDIINYIFWRQNNSIEINFNVLFFVYETPITLYAIITYNRHIIGNKRTFDTECYNFYFCIRIFKLFYGVICKQF